MWTLTLTERDHANLRVGDRVSVDGGTDMEVTYKAGRTLRLEPWPSRWQRAKRRVLLTFRSLLRR